MNQKKVRGIDREKNCVPPKLYGHRCHVTGVFVVK